MKNCIIAQSGGPTAVINASAVGIYEQNVCKKYFDKIYFGINGINGILHENIIDSTSIEESNILSLKLTPSSGLGSCRYSLCDFQEDESDYKKVISILKKYDIDTFFYIGGTDSMDTVLKFSQYAEENNIDIKFICIPKTIDNNLLGTDHCPGYGSAAKLIATITLETFLDSSVYEDNGIFILETMGKDTGWLAASAALAQLNGKPVADFIYLPEAPFDFLKFLEDVKEKYNEKKQVYIVVSEGIKGLDGNPISNAQFEFYDTFSNNQVNSVSEILKKLIINSGITSRVKTLELGVIQRCAMHCISKVDIEEAYAVGAYAAKLSKENLTGIMVTINRANSDPYDSYMGYEFLNKITNSLNYFPANWINSRGNHITEEGIKFIAPLLVGNINLKYINGLPVYSRIYE